MAHTSGTPTSVEERAIALACLCGEARASVNMPKAYQDLKLELCHCSICRHQSGLPCAFIFQIPPAYSDTFAVTGPLTTFAATPQVPRSFCSKCGANMYLTSHDENATYGWAGVLECPQLLQRAAQFYLSSTDDGGIAIWFRQTPLWSTGSDIGKGLQLFDFTTKSQPGTDREDTADTLACYCQCKSISFRIAPPPTDTTAFPPDFSAGPYSDLLMPFHTNNPRRSNPDNEPWFLRKVRSQGVDGDHSFSGTTTTTRYLAGLCACRSCRRASGGLFQSWAFIPAHLLLSATGEDVLDIESLRSANPEDVEGKGGKGGGLRTYQSSNGNYRDFCSKCGATVFWRSDGRKDVFDVSVGLLDAGGDVRAERWLDWWTDRVSFEEEAEGEEALRMLKVGLASWGAEKAAVER